MENNHRARSVAVLVFLTLLNILNFADRYLMQGFAVDMIADLHLSNTEFTLLTGYAFAVFYTLMGLLMGALADRFHRPRLMAAGLVVWSALTAATGLAANFIQTAWARMFIGIGEATLTPAALGLLGDEFRREHRAFASGFYYLGVPIGIGGAFIIAGTLGAAVGWRNCFFILGALGVVLSALLLLMREPRTAVTHAATRRPLGHVIREIREALSASTALCLVIAGGVLVIFSQGAFILDQVWMVQERGFSKQGAQKILGTVFLFGGIAGSILGGFLADRMQARRKGGRLYFLALAYLIGVPIGMFYRVVDPTGNFFYVGMFINSMLITLGFGPVFAAVADLAAAEVRSTMTAFLILGMTLLGTSPGNLLAGWLTDTFKAATVAEPITKAVLIGMSPWLLAIPCFFFAARLVERKAIA